MRNLIISSLEIPFDENNRVRLNDIHKAIGGAESKSPKEWMKRESTKEYIAHLNRADSPSLAVEVLEGRNGGTWAVEKACLDYAAWVSPQAKDLVYDGFLAYHKGETKPEAAPLIPNNPLDYVPSAMRAAEAFGFKGNHAIISANKAVKSLTSVDVLEAMGETQLIAENKKQTVTPTDIAETIGVGSRAINPALIDMGLQTSFRDHKDRIKYELTEKGSPFGEMSDTGKKDGNGAPVKQLKWFTDVIPMVKKHFEEKEEN